MNVIAIASAAAIEPMRMSRFFTWLISWASTPRISSGSRTCMQALGDAHHGVARVATRRERVGLRRRRQVDARHRLAGALGEVAHDRVQLRRVAARSTGFAPAEATASLSLNQ